MPTNRKPQRPRLEYREASDVSGAISVETAVRLTFQTLGESAYISLKDAKRLHAFLAKAIAYLEAKKAGRGE